MRRILVLAPVGPVPFTASFSAPTGSSLVTDGSGAPEPVPVTLLPALVAEARVFATYRPLVAELNRLFENLGLDFFPAQWLVRVGETTASMTSSHFFMSSRFVVPLILAKASSTRCVVYVGRIFFLAASCTSDQVFGGEGQDPHTPLLVHRQLRCSLHTLLQRRVPPCLPFGFSRNLETVRSHIGSICFLTVSRSSRRSADSAAVGDVNRWGWRRANVAELNRRGREAWDKLGRLSGKELLVGDTGYTVLARGEKQMAGVMKPPMEMPPNWGVYFINKDVDAIATKTKAAGGRAYMEPTDMPEVGRIAVLADPQGAAFGVSNGG